MQVSIKGLINRLDSLRERINNLFDNLDRLDRLDQEEIELEDVEQYLQNDDAFNLSIALDVLKETEKLNRTLEIIKKIFFRDLLFDDEKQVIKFSFHVFILYAKINDKTEYDLLKEVLK